MQSDYSDYSFFYDTLFGSGAAFYDNAGDLINPSQFINGKDGYTKISNELRFTTPAEYKVHAVVGGLFQQRQTHDIEQAYDIAGLADDERRHGLGRHVLADQAVARRPRHAPCSASSPGTSRTSSR